MGSALNNEQLSVLESPGPERYRYFMSQFMAMGRLWIAESADDVLTLFDENEHELLPVWPSPEFLEETLSEDQKGSGFRPVLRSFSQWEKKTTPALIREGVSVGVFPNKLQSCPIVDPATFLSHLANSYGKAVLQESGIAKIRRRVRRKKTGQRKPRPLT